MDRHTKFICQNFLISFAYYKPEQASFYDTEIKMAERT
jgi:hypothetical protein